MKYYITLAVAVIMFLPRASSALETTIIDQKGLMFSVPMIEIKKGAAIIFKNSDNTSHNILIRGNGVVFNSGLQPPGVIFKAPFRKTGTYDIFCGIHARMKMSVIVK